MLKPETLSKKNAIILIIVGIVLVMVGVYFLFTENTFEITQGDDEEVLVYEPHPLTGQRCKNYDKRPMAVMLSIDKITRPLSSIAMADVVIEMPVVKDSITRLMALYICSEPEDIGSVRSSRRSFIPLAAGFDAIYAHWGGSNFALEDLNKGVLDNIDAMINPTEAFYRKNGLPIPHDGFTSYQSLQDAVQYLGYRLQNEFEGYGYVDDNPASGGPTTLRVEYPAPYNISYIYNREKNSYLRWRGSSPELDKLTGGQVETKIIVVLKTTSRQLNADYNDVVVTGEGDALIFQNGKVQKAKWQKAKSPVNSKLVFLDELGEEIKFVIGKMWLEYIDIGTPVTWGEENL